MLSTYWDLETTFPYWLSRLWRQLPVYSQLDSFNVFIIFFYIILIFVLFTDINDTMVAWVISIICSLFVLDLRALFSWQLRLFPCEPKETSLVWAFLSSFRHPWSLKQLFQCHYGLLMSWFLYPHNHVRYMLVLTRARSCLPWHPSLLGAILFLPPRKTSRWTLHMHLSLIHIWRCRRRG